MQTECNSLAAWKMEAGPPLAGCRIGPQAAWRYVGISSQGMNGLARGEIDSSGTARMANGSEPRTFCREPLNRHRNQADLAAWDKPSGSPFVGGFGAFSGFCSNFRGENSPM